MWRLLLSFEADLQYDPRDIVKFLPLLDISYDIVSGWRCHHADLGEYSKAYTELISVYGSKELLEQHLIRHTTKILPF